MSVSAELQSGGTSALDESLTATLQHIELLRDKQLRLKASQLEAEAQFLHRVNAAYAAGLMDDEGLVEAYKTYAGIAVSGFTRHWNAHVSVPAARMQYAVKHQKTLDRHAPNGPNGTWQGTWPLDGGRVPLAGVCVVYVLFNTANGPCYVGSTKDLPARLKRHRRDSKPFVRWTAFPCSDRDAAYELEDKLLNEHMPYLNKRRGR